MSVMKRDSGFDKSKSPESKSFSTVNSSKEELFVYVIYSINPFHGTSLFLYPQKASQNLRFSDVFRGYWKASDIWKVHELNWAVVL